MTTPRSGREEQPQWPLARPHVKCEENEKGAEENALKTIFEENGCRRKCTFIPAENTQFRVGGHSASTDPAQWCETMYRNL